MIDISSLTAQMDERGWTGVTASLVARCHGKLGKDGREAIAEMLKAEGTVRGFNKPLKAPPAILKAGLLEAVSRSSYARTNLFLAWLQLRWDLIKTIDDLIEGRIEEGPEVNLEITELLREAHPDIGLEEYALALEYVRLRNEQAPSEAGDEVETGGDGDQAHPTRFLQWLADLEGLPPGADEWRHISWLLEQISAMGQRKHDAYCAESRDALRSGLIELGGVAGVLEGLFLHVEEWSEEHCSSDGIDSAVEQLAGFIESLERHYAVESEIPASLSEKREKRLRLTDIESEIEQKYDLLNSLLSPPPEASAGDGESTGELADSPPTGNLAAADGNPAYTGLPDSGEQGEAALDETGNEKPIDTGSEPDTQALPQIDRNTEQTKEDVGEVGVVQASEAAATPAPSSAGNLPGSGEVEPRAPSLPQTDASAWKMLHRGDLMSAFWLARCQGEATPIPDWLVGALVASRWLARGASRVEEDLLKLIQLHPMPDSPVHQSLGIAAALFPAIAFPGSGASAWLASPDPALVALKPILEVVQRFAVTGLPLELEDIKESHNREFLDRATREAAEKCKNWLEQAEGRKFSYAPAGEVFQHLCSRGGTLGSMIAVASSDRRQEVDGLSASLSTLRSRDARIDMIRDAEQLARRPIKGREIEGKGFTQLLGTVEDGLELAVQWMHAATRWRVAAEQGEWWQAHVHELVKGLKAHLPVAISALNAAADIDATPEVRAAAACSVASLEELSAFVDGRTPHGDLPPLVDSGLWSGLSFHLLRYPGLPLGSDEFGNPRSSDADVGQLRVRLLSEAGQLLSLADAVQGWCDVQDFRWLDRLAGELKDDCQRLELQDRIEKAREESRARLLDALGQTRVHLEQAHLEGTIDPDTRSRVESQLEEVQEKVEGDNVHFGEQVGRLAALTQEIDNSRQKVLSERSERWDELRPRAHKLLEPAQATRLDEMVREALERRDMYLVDELLPSVEASLENDRKEDVANLLASAEGTERVGRDAFHRYRSERERLLSLFRHRQLSLRELERQVLRKEAPEELGLRNLPEPRLQEVAKALAAWQHLKGLENPERRTDIAHPVFALLRYLGFRMKPDSKDALHQANSGRNWVRFTASLLGDPTSPVPQFGSMLGAHLDALCLWERPGVSIVEAITREAKLDKAACVIIYLGQLAPRQWDDMARHAYKSGRQALVLDETLLLYLAREYESRLEPFLQCTLPATDVNPYVPNAAGNVPREMFVGRVEPLRRLRDPLGPALVYGGRQLGKSSLLKQLQRDFDDPSTEHYALLEDIRRIGGSDKLEPPDRVWERIARGLKEKGLIKGQPPTTADRVEKELRSVMKLPRRRILVLLDEADAFLTQDALNGFPVLNRLKEIMDATERRFKVVFAGLHNVRRFSAIPNQPLAHLGSPIVVGPLDPRNARELVKRPMEALGYQFRDDGVVLSILSLTNYHPGLIQLFCDHLIRHLRYQRQELPPYRVTEEDVQAVYRDHALRQEIRDRFLWTINLDTHYGVLVRAVILDQMDHRDGYSLTYSLQELRQLGQDRWKAGFESLSPDYMRDYVQELTELWTFAPAGQGRYRLRSPNLVRLLGPKDEIDSYLKSVVDSSGQDDPWHDQDLLHPRVQETPTLYSPLSLGQLRRIGVGPSGVTIVFGSDATGLDRVPAALAGVATAGGGTRFQHLSLLKPEEPISLLDALRKRVRDGQTGNLVLSGPANFDRRPLPQQVRTALDFCESLPPTEKRWVRVVLTMGTNDLMDWLQIAPQDREELETRCGAVVLGRWGEGAVAHWLEEHDLPRTTAIDRKVIEVSGGYQWLLDCMLKTGLGQRGRNVALMAEQLHQLLVDPLSETNQQFRFALGIAPNSFLEKLYRALSSIISPGDSAAGDALADLAQSILEMPRVQVDLGLIALERLGLLDRQEDRLAIEAVARRLLGGQ